MRPSASHFFQASCGKGSGCAAAIGERQRSRSKPRAAFGLVGSAPCGSKQMLPSPPHRVERGGRLLG